MAQMTTIMPVEFFHGSFVKRSGAYARVVNGKMYFIKMEHPRGEKDFSEHEKAYRKNVGKMSKLASAINKDPEQAKAYDDWKKQGYTSRYRYILARLIHNNSITST